MAELDTMGPTTVAGVGREDQVWWMVVEVGVSPLCMATAD